MNQALVSIKNNQKISSQKSSQLQNATELELKQKMKLQGQRKIIDYVFLRPSLPKILIFGIPLILSIIGLYCLIKHKRFRVRTFFSMSTDFDPSATHIFVTIDDHSTELTSIHTQLYNDQHHFTFVSQLLKYEIINNRIYPVGSAQIDRLSGLLSSKKWIENGLSTEEWMERLSFFGGNEHKVQIPGYFSQMFEIMTEPLFLLQYFIFCVWIIQQLYINTLANFSFCLAVNTVNYIIQYYNFCKIKQMAQKEFTIKVIRNHQFVQIDNADIVPGDIYEVCHQIPCDSVIINGDAMVNEVNFTGENLPILKCSIEDLSQFTQTAHWIYEGSQILKVKEGTLAMAIHTGYTSHRGQIIRKIVKHSVKEPEFTHHILKFFVLSYLLAGLIYLVYLAKLMTLRIREDTIVFLFFQIVSLAVPVGYIGVLNFFPGMSLIRLDLSAIYGKEPYKVYESAQIKTICFDKTGTLTKNAVELADIYLCKENGCHKSTNNFQIQPLIRQLFATCHMVKQVQDSDFRGDEIDLKMFERSGARILPSSKQGILWQISTKGQTFEVLRVNQFQSKHMSMSVLVRNKFENQAFIFIKGSPQLIFSLSTKKWSKVPQLIKELSFQGFRSIGIAYKQIEPQKVANYIKMPREMYLQDIEMLGLVSFVNKLKDEAPGVIERLRSQVQVNVKMITGDNIYTAVQTSFKADLISENQSVVVCEGKNILNRTEMKVKALLIQNQQGVLTEKEIVIPNLYTYLRSNEEKNAFALEGCFLHQNLFDAETIDKIKVFARVSPENKTLIVKNIQLALQKEHSQRTAYQKLFGTLRQNVCMVGDGANDLMAIKQADVGIGLSESDGTFSADFVVSRLEQIEQIIREGKSISQVAIQTLLMFFINTWLYIPLMLLTLHDLCTFSQQTMFYKNLGFIILIPFLQGLTKPKSQNTPIAPQMNILAPQHQLTIWINNLVFTASFTLCFLVYWKSDDFQTNHRGWVSMKDQFTTYSKSSTLCFKLIVGHCMAIIFNMYQNRPWKESLTSNMYLTGWLILQLLLGYIAYFRQQWLPLMNLAPLSNSVSSMVLIIMALTFLVSFIAVSLINKYFVLEKCKEKLVKGNLS